MSIKTTVISALEVPLVIGKAAATFVPAHVTLCG
jgi:hypothetical protein